MKTKYEAPEINVLTLCVDDVIITSGGTTSGLQSQSIWKLTTTGDSTYRGLWN